MTHATPPGSTSFDRLWYLHEEARWERIGQAAKVRKANRLPVPGRYQGWPIWPKNYKRKPAGGC